MSQQVELTVTRPNGKTEIVIHPTLMFITADQFKQIQQGTKNAGRGDTTSYRNLRDGIEIKPATMANSKGNYERGLKAALKNPGTKAIEDMSAAGE